MPASMDRPRRFSSGLRSVSMPGKVFDEGRFAVIHMSGHTIVR